MPTRFKEYEGKGFYVESLVADSGQVMTRYLYVVGEAMPIASQHTIKGNAAAWAIQKIRARIKSGQQEVNNYEYAVHIAKRKLAAWEKLAEDNL